MMPYFFKPIFSILLLLIVHVCFAQNLNVIDHKIDSIFSSYNSTTPGVAVVVVKDGEIVFKKGYGMANLEHNIAITTETVFDIASVSKQFTAFTMYLLESEGKLSLDDEVKKYISELPDYAKTIKIKHLIAHTSGLRDHGALVSMAGFFITDLMHTEQILKMMHRQKGLEAVPGTVFRYCNSSYVLLTEIVRRVTGKSFAEYATQKIFKPLGMENTRFADNHQLVIRNRADSYEKENDQYFHIPSMNTTPGPSGLLTTAEDLVKWVMNFEKPKVGNAQLIKSYNEPSYFNDGRKVFSRVIDGDTIFHAKGQNIWRHKGAKIFSHGGHTAGFRMFLGRFPDHGLSIIQLSNDEHNENLGGRWDIADFFIKELQADIKAATVASTPTPNTKKAEDKFLSHLNSFAGKYYSEELETTYDFVIKDGKLVMQHSRLADITLKQIGENKFSGSGPNTFYFEIVFSQNKKGKITRLDMSNWGAKNIKFGKLNI
jgi:CubicO group peptidase (beta-lactamase class C family)